jgi:hypothetical protein
MKYLVQFVIFVAFLPLHAEPLHDLLKEYANGYLSVSKESNEIADAVRDSYPETFFVMNNEDGTIFDVLRKNEVKDTIMNGNKMWIRNEAYRAEESIKRYDYEKLELLIDEINRMIEASVPQINFYTKSISVKENFLNSDVFKVKVKEFKYFLKTLVEIVSVIKSKDALFLPQYDPLENIGDLKHWRNWYDVMLEIQKLEIEKSLRKFEIRYGENSDRVNLIELFVMNLVPLFKGNANGPSSWEPILRFTPVCYDFTDMKFVKTFQIGVNYYFFSESFLKHVHHVGIAFLLTDIESEKIYEIGTLSYGGVIHLGKYQVGIVKDNGNSSFKLISTIDFQILPGLF